MNTPRTITVHSFCSATGGAGKSVLAIASAKILAAGGRFPALLDCDFTGTSIADGLRLCAPRVVLAGDGSLDLDANPTEEVLSHDKTSSLRDARGRASWDDKPPPPPYLNDALTYQSTDPARECRLDAMVWRHERTDNVRYFPSSPLRKDVSIALGWIFGDTPLEWLRRMVWLLDEMATRFDDLTDVILDLPPGLWGFAHEASVLVSRIERQLPWPEGYPSWENSAVQWRANPILVVPPDRNGLYVSLEYLAKNASNVPGLLPIVNRNHEGLSAVRDAVRSRFGGVRAGLGLEEKLRSVDEMRSTLGRVFLDQDLPLTDEVKAMAKTLRLTGLQQ